MEIEEIKKSLIECITKNLVESKNEVVALDGDTVLLNDIDGFDSLRAIEVLVDFEEIVNTELPPETILLDENNAPISINEICSRVHNIVKGQ